MTTACSSSACALVAVFDSSKLIFTSGWSFLNVVETTKKIRRIVRISTSDTMMMEGARRLRTANFTDVDLASRHWRDFGGCGLSRRDRLGRNLLLFRPHSSHATVITF